MNDFIQEDIIREYLAEYESLEMAISALEDRQETIDSILRNHHNFAIGEDRLIDVVG